MGERGDKGVRGTGGLWGPSPDTARKEAEEALGLLEESQCYLRSILLGIALQYRSLDMERQRILAGEQAGSLCGPGPVQVQGAASLITLWALLGFQQQAQHLACGAAQRGLQPDMMDVKLGAVSILVSLLRLFRLWQASQQTGPAEELGQLEALDQPPDL